MFDQFNHAANALNLATNSLTDTNTSNLALAGTSAGLTDPLQQNIRAASSASFSATSPGVFTVGATGKVNFDYLFDGGAYEGEVAIFDLDGMDRYFQAGSEFFAREAALRALTNTDLGHIVISDQTEGAALAAAFPTKIISTPAPTLELKPSLCTPVNTSVSCLFPMAKSKIWFTTETGKLTNLPCFLSHL